MKFVVMMSRIKKISPIYLVVIFLTSCRASINENFPTNNAEGNVNENNTEKGQIEVKFSCGENGISEYLDDGWNMFGYCSNQIIDISQVLGENDNYIDIMKDNNGDQYWPEFNYNSIGNFTPGSGYQIKVNNSFSISF